MKTKVLTFVLTLFPLPVAVGLLRFAHPTMGGAIAIIAATVCTFVYGLRLLDPSDKPAKPSATSTEDPEAWPPSPKQSVDKVDPRLKSWASVEIVLRTCLRRIRFALSN